MNELTPEQIKQIEKKFEDLWNEDIYVTILTPNQRENITSVLFGMETLLERFAASFGLGGIE